MTTRANIFIVLVLLAFGSAPTLASEPRRDANIDLVRISARYLENYAKSEHKAGDTDGVFIEDVVIPSVVSVTKGYKGSIPPAVRGELYGFLIAGKSMASEELSSLGSELYLSSPKQFCSDLSKIDKVNGQYLMRRARDGVALNGRSNKVACS